MAVDAHSIDALDPPARLRCFIGAPTHYRAKAEYALTTLLRPLGLGVLVEESPSGPTSRDSPGPGIWYAPEPPPEPGWLHLPLDPGTPARITSGVKKDDVRWVEWGGDTWPVLFPGGRDDEGDLVASAFYWLAGIDEHANRERDRFGRPTGSASFLQALGAVRSAPVDAYREILADLLRNSGARLRRRTWGGQGWCFCPTFDVDYTRKWRPGILYRETVQHFLLGRGPGPGPSRGPGARLARLAQGMKQWVTRPDPYRAALVRIQVELDRAGAQGTFFFKAGDHGPHDVSYGLSSRFIRERFNSLLGNGHQIGLHPSFFAFNHAGYVNQEKARLERALGTSVSAARTHYLRFDWPATPNALENAGFSVDSTLGFPDQPGYRSGTCLPFQIWEHEKNRASSLWEFPLAFMDSGLFNRLHLDRAEAGEIVQTMAATAQRFGGLLVGLWHNVLWDEPDFSGWGEHMVDTIQMAAEKGAAMATFERAMAGWSAMVD